MTLAKLEVRNVRNIQTVSMEPSPQLNVLVGANGSGKTSLLEGIYILGRARSFRSTQAAQVINFNQDRLTVTGRLLEESGRAAVSVGVQLSRRRREMVLAGVKLQSSADLIWAFPVSIIQPTSTTLFENAPKYRRQFLDWGVFHVDHTYLANWRGYVRALAQRNALLRSGDHKDLQTWDHELDRYGTIVATARAAYAERLRPRFIQVAQLFLGQYEFSLHSCAGWDAAKRLCDVLQEGFASDRRHGFTLAGPHKGDFSVQADGRPAKAVLSRGQMKLLVFSLLLAQASLLEELDGKPGCVLIDDLASELDGASRDRLLRYLKMCKQQFFLTATDPQVLKHESLAEAAVFHVEHGRVV